MARDRLQPPGQSTIDAGIVFLRSAHRVPIERDGLGPFARVADQIERPLAVPTRLEHADRGQRLVAQLLGVAVFGPRQVAPRQLEVVMRRCGELPRP